MQLPAKAAHWPQGFERQRIEPVRLSKPTEVVALRLILAFQENLFNLQVRAVKQGERHNQPVRAENS